MIGLEIDFPDNNLKKLELKLKYGFDGTRCNTYGQKWDNPDNNDSHIFCS